MVEFHLGWSATNGTTPFSLIIVHVVYNSHCRREFTKRSSHPFVALIQSLTHWLFMTHHQFPPGLLCVNTPSFPSTISHFPSEPQAFFPSPFSYFIQAPAPHTPDHPHHNHVLQLFCPGGCSPSHHPDPPAPRGRGGPKVSQQYNFKGTVTQKSFINFYDKKLCL